MVKDEFDFNGALTEIQEINRWFQNEDISLDEGLAKLQRGLELIKKCNARITEVENQFVEIKQKYGVREESTSATASEITIEESENSDDMPF